MRLKAIRVGGEREHWERVYREREAGELSWYEPVEADVCSHEFGRQY